jgi:aspartyl-tRNA(Asn)/glutamyl-tRNA(Gln) amidotransferase subunit C
MTGISVDVAALAKLARLEVSDEELARLEKEIPDILKFVETIQKADVSGVTEAKSLRNVMRVDENPIESGKHTEALLKAAPAREGNRVAVKQVISRKKS